MLDEGNVTAMNEAIEKLHAEAASAGRVDLVVLCESALDGGAASRARLVGASEHEVMVAEIQATLDSMTGKRAGKRESAETIRSVTPGDEAQFLEWCDTVLEFQGEGC